MSVQLKELLEKAGLTGLADVTTDASLVESLLDFFSVIVTVFLGDYLQECAEPLGQVAGTGK